MIALGRNLITYGRSIFNIFTSPELRAGKNQGSVFTA